MRKTYTIEYKIKAVLELLREEQSVSQVAAKYEIQPNQLIRWKKAVIEGMGESLSDKRKKDMETKEMQSLI